MPSNRHGSRRNNQGEPSFCAGGHGGPPLRGVRIREQHQLSVGSKPPEAHRLRGKHIHTFGPSSGRKRTVERGKSRTAGAREVDISRIVAR